MGWAKRLDDVAEEYFSYVGRYENSSEYTVKSVYMNHIHSLYGKKKVKSLKMKDMDDLQSIMIKKRYDGDKKYSNKTINNVTNILNIIMNFAVKKEYISSNPCANYTRLKLFKDYDRTEFWTDEQFKAAIKYEEDYMWYCYLTLSYLTGMRKGEMRGLKWKDIDFDKELIHIRRHINDKRIHRADESDDKEWIIAGRKNGSELTLRMDHNAKGILDKLLHQNQECNRCCDYLFVFGGKHPVSQNSPKRHLDKIADLAGLPRIKVHGLRHSHVSFLISRGLNAYEIAQRIGDDVEMVYKVYGHMFPDPQANVIKELDENFNFSFEENGKNKKKQKNT